MFTAETLFDHASCTRQDLSIGSRLFRHGDVPRRMQLVLRGRLALERHGAGLVLRMSARGEMIAEAFSDSYHCDTVAVEPATVLAVDRKAVLDRMRRDPDVALAFAAHLARQVQAQRRQLAIQAIRGAEERVLAAISETCPARLTDLAAEIALSPEAVYRALARLVRAGRAEKLGRGRYRASPEGGRSALLAAAT